MLERGAGNTAGQQRTGAPGRREAGQWGAEEQRERLAGGTGREAAPTPWRLQVPSTGILTQETPRASHSWRPLPVLHPELRSDAA